MAQNEPLLAFQDLDLSKVLFETLAPTARSEEFPSCKEA